MSDLEIILSPEAQEFITNVRALELTEEEAQEQCKRFGLRPFWPVPAIEWEMSHA